MGNKFYLKGVIQNYKWGGDQFILDLLGEKYTKEPVAEYWMGAHVNAPSTVETEQGNHSLDVFLNSKLR